MIFLTIYKRGIMDLKQQICEIVEKEFGLKRNDWTVINNSQEFFEYLCKSKAFTLQHSNQLYDSVVNDCGKPFRVINDGRCFHYEKVVTTPPFFEEAKKALERRLWSLNREFALAETRIGEIIKRLRKALGETQYKHLKMEVCAEVANRAYPGNITTVMGNPQHWFLREAHSSEDDQGIKIENAYTGIAIGVVKLNNKQAAEACLKLMQTELFEGDITI
jgi:hypothetical protein